MDYEKGIITEIKRYLDDTTYQYAILINGGWGIGKTYFIENKLIPALNDTKYAIKYISLYGCNSRESVRDTIVEKILGDLISEKLESKATENVHGDVKEKRIKTLHAGSGLLKRAMKVLISKEIIDGDILEMVQGAIKDNTSLENTFLILDDVERCYCSPDEIMGALNDLVEHDKTKMLIVANEAEIGSYNADNARLSERYQKIREKLIGITIDYTPDLVDVMHHIIKRVNDAGLKEILKSQVARYKQYMQVYNHYNFRTFQFFISKIKFLYDSYSKMSFEKDMPDSIAQDMVMQCFLSALKYKANIPDDKVKGRITLKFVETYVVSGIYNEERAKTKLSDYFDDYYRNAIPDDDAAKLLENEYLKHDPEWVNEQVEQIIKNLKKNKYPPQRYGDILETIMLFKDHLDQNPNAYAKALSLMKRNIDKMFEPSLFIPLSRYRIDPTKQEQYEDSVAELNSLIKKANANMDNTLSSVLSDNDWVNSLKKRLNDRHGHWRGEIIFDMVEPIDWVNRLINSSSEQLYEFNQYILKLYTGSYEPVEEDVKCIKEIVESIDSLIENGDATDWIQEENLRRLREILYNLLPEEESFLE
ncbi:P-loop NTPase fold protein [Butyrivibrio sp. XPD2006]|uniref:P-loop NTPase fold protein n=1 Tax=Butyrivibrio sp. XPD2006 TaxID=1280668 RepID=UPI0003B6A9B3|nr:P-loop NTPase fold protein [Butyrivibrio sp. XPD2006]